MAVSPYANVKFKDLDAYTSILVGAITGKVNLSRENGEYVNIQDEFFTRRDGLRYQVKIPLYSYSTSPICVKEGANAGLVIEPSSNTYAGRDDYAGRLSFTCITCNGFIGDDGVPHVTAIFGDEWFKFDGSNGDVWVLAPTLYWSCVDTSTHKIITISDTHHDGLDVQPGGKMANATERPFMLYARYAGSKYTDGKLASVSGLPLWNRTISHNSLIDAKNAKGAGYAGKTRADDWYVQIMYLMKYANKSSQSTFAGCTGYTSQYSPAIAETGVKRVIITKAQAASLLVGSWMMLGTGTSTDRGNAACYDIFDASRITKIEAIDADNSAVYFDVPNTFDTTITQLLSTAPYGSGYCDNVQGPDGSPTSRTNGKEPFLIQNIECGVGAYEVLSDVIMDAKADEAGNLSENIFMCFDSANYSKSITANYVDTGVSLPIAASDGWSYSCDFVNAHGLLIPDGFGATSTTGTGDAVYQNVSTSKGQREWLGVGDLSNGSIAGLRCVRGDYGLTSANWSIAGRLSALGRSAA